MVGDVIIPSNITDENGNTYIVTTIGDGAFKGNEEITSVTIPQTITSIGCEAFADCINLDTIFMQSAIPQDICETAFSTTKTKGGITVIVP